VYTKLYFQLDVCVSMHHSTIHKEKIQQDATMYQNFIIPFLYDAQHFWVTHYPSSGA
jgi:hypothetical protein